MFIVFLAWLHVHSRHQVKTFNISKLCRGHPPNVANCKFLGTEVIKLFGCVCLFRLFVFQGERSGLGSPVFTETHYVITPVQYTCAISRLKKNNFQLKYYDTFI